MPPHGTHYAAKVRGTIFRSHRNPLQWHKEWKIVIRFYAKRLERDLKRWHEKGWVTGEGYRAILAEQRQGSKLTASAALAAIGAVLLGFAAMSFVAANWNEIPRIFRVAMLLAGLWTAHGSAAYLYKRELPDFAQAAVLTGSLIFGAAVMLVSQMYHIDSGNLPGFMFLWMSGAAAAGILFRSSLTLGCAMLLAGAWQIAEWDAMPQEVKWHFLPVWAALTGLIAWNRSGMGLHVAAAVLTAWIVHIEFALPSHPYAIVAALGAAGVLAAAGVMATATSSFARQIAIRAIPYAIIVCFGGLLPQDPDTNAPAIEAVLAIAAGIGLASLMLNQTAGRLQQIAPTLFSYALAVSLYGLFIVQFWWKMPLDNTITIAALTLAVLAGALICGIQVRSRLVMWLAYGGIVAEIVTLYLEKLGNLINTSLFFLVMGVAIIALARVVMRYGNAPRETEVRS